MKRIGEIGYQLQKKFLTLIGIMPIKVKNLDQSLFLQFRFKDFFQFFNFGLNN